MLDGYRQDRGPFQLYSGHGGHAPHQCVFTAACGQAQATAAELEPGHAARVYAETLSVSAQRE